MNPSYRNDETASVYLQTAEKKLDQLSAMVYPRHYDHE